MKAQDLFAIATPANQGFAEPEPPPDSSDAECTAVCNLLLTGRSTREESRKAVRLLLRQAARKLERGR